jgi:adenylate cyclase
MKSQAKNKPKILVVDDELDNLDLLYRTFHRDYTVLRATSGPAALELLAQEGDVAAIISDQRMPMMSGTEFLSLTATQYPDIIRIILTGYTDVDDLVEAINTGKVFKYVTKPWEAEELKAVVRQALDTHNVLKARTQELCRSLRQESLLNTVTNTIRSALDYRQILQTIVDTVGHVLDIDICLLRPFQDGQLASEGFIYQRQDTFVDLPVSHLLSELLWETRDVQVIYEVAADERIHSDNPQIQNRAEAFASANIQSSLVVPLICRQELMAVLALHQCNQPRQWVDDEVQLVLMVADQAALAISQAAALEQVRALAKRQELINTITTTIRSSLNPQDIFAAITEQLGQALQVDGCVLSLWTQEDEYVQCVGLYDSGENSPATGVEEDERLQVPQSLAPIAGNPVLQELLRIQQPVVIPDMSNSPLEISDFDLPLRAAARSLLVVPLLADGKSIGSITLREANQPRQWHSTDIELAQAVAEQAAIAVQQSRLYQKTRQQAERLLELDRQKTEFFQNISHEFRTPLTLMLGPLESAVTSSQGLNYEQSVIALRNCRRLLRLVNQLLDLQRLDAGRMQPRFRPCDLVAFVTQVVESFRPYCEKKGLHLQTQMDKSSKVYIDSEKFDKVLYNLLSNAMKFTPEGGIITVRVQQAGDHCLVQVEDTGIGMTKEEIPHLFERFRQAERSTSRSYEGSGLGLALAKELVELHNGDISVESTFGKGTTFSIWLHTGTAHLPIDQVLEVPSEVNRRRASVELADLELLELEADNTENISSKRLPITDTQHSILVVDDNPDLRGYVLEILRNNGYQVYTARNGAEGLRVAQETTPSLILTDLMMPLVSGIEMIRSLRADENLKGTPIILLTAKVDEETRIEGAEHGADAYLAKPFNDRELLAEVRNLLALKEKEREVLKLNSYLTDSVLRRFLPPALVQQAAVRELVLDQPPELKLVTILFSDIVGFTQLSNTLRSRRVAEVLNEYLAAMTKTVFDNGGTIDKFVGDAVLALFGAPEELTPNEQVRRAINTARAMHQELAKLNERWQQQGLFDSDGRSGIQFRCGIHQGTAVVGMFGSEQRSDYTAIGPCVNIAARLQEAASPDTILVSAAVADYLEESEITKYSPLELKGVDETVLTFLVKS